MQQLQRLPFTKNSLRHLAILWGFALFWDLREKISILRGEWHSRGPSVYCYIDGHLLSSLAVTYAQPRELSELEWSTIRKFTYMSRTQKTSRASAALIVDKEESRQKLRPRLPLAPARTSPLSARSGGLELCRLATPLENVASNYKLARKKNSSYEQKLSKNP